MTKEAKQRWLKALFVAVGLVLWFQTQDLIGSRLPEGDNTKIIDLPMRWTAPINQYLHEHRVAADVLLAFSSLIIETPVK